MRCGRNQSCRSTRLFEGQGQFSLTNSIHLAFVVPLCHAIIIPFTQYYIYLHTETQFQQPRREQKQIRNRNLVVFLLNLNSPNPMVFFVYTLRLVGRLCRQPLLPVWWSSSMEEPKHDFCYKVGASKHHSSCSLDVELNLNLSEKHLFRLESNDGRVSPVLVECISTHLMVSVLCLKFRYVYIIV